MVNSRILQQFSRETESWKRLLNFLSEENVHLKTSIAEIAWQEMNPELLDKVEIFQNRLIQEDEIIALVRLEVADFQRQVSRDHISAGAGRNIFQAQNSLRKNIESLEHGFNKLKFEFNHYLGEKLR